MKRAIIETPYGKDPSFYSVYAKHCMQDSIDRGEAPMASHILYAVSDVLSENIKSHRDLGIRMGYRWMEVADLIVFYTDYGWSIGMEAAYLTAIELKKPIEYRTISKQTETLKKLNK